MHKSHFLLIFFLAKSESVAKVANLPRKSYNT